MDTPVIKRGVIQALNPANWTATVQVLPSQGNYLSDVQVAKHLLAAEIVPGDQCAVLFFEELNPADAIIIAVYSVPPAAPIPPVTSLAGGSGGAALTGDVQLVPGPSGAVTISESGQQIVIDASGGGGSGSAPLVSTTASTVTITDTSNHTLETLSFTLAAGVTALIVGTIEYKYNSSPAGLHLLFFLDGTQIGPQAAGANGGIMVNQSTEPQQFTIAFYQAIASGAHTLTLVVSEALSVGTATISWSQLAVKY